MVSNNTEYMITYMKSYYGKNKEKINEKKQCELCNLEIAKKHFKQHLLTDKHKKIALIKDYENQLNILKN